MYEFSLKFKVQNPKVSLPKAEKFHQCFNNTLFAGVMSRIYMAVALRAAVAGANITKSFTGTER